MAADVGFEDPPAKTLWSSGYTIVLSFVDEFGSVKGELELRKLNDVKILEGSQCHLIQHRNPF